MRVPDCLTLPSGKDLTSLGGLPSQPSTSQVISELRLRTVEQWLSLVIGSGGGGIFGLLVCVEMNLEVIT